MVRNFYKQRPNYPHRSTPLNVENFEFDASDAKPGNNAILQRQNFAKDGSHKKHLQPEVSHLHYTKTNIKGKNNFAR
jgi:hypothetical protein